MVIHIMAVGLVVKKNGSGEVIFCVLYKPQEIIEHVIEENNDFRI